ncbi:hypothetical protein CH339_10050 [Rhodobium orientis]|uniref:Uncharacterized protein n=2 Tax=Rhodobium orientis TaxID=34017 RepID=A0A327JPB4_9HYPH|nr:hypothetical protein CH339_10050 [Rhodobium orientis]
MHPVYKIRPDSSGLDPAIHRAFDFKRLGQFVFEVQADRDRTCWTIPCRTAGLDCFAALAMTRYIFVVIARVRRTGSGA